MPNIEAIGQLFSPSGSYTPTKAAVYLRPSINRTGEGIFVLSSDDVVIDATNFSSIGDSSGNLVIDINDSGATGKGCMALIDPPVLTSDASTLYFPIRALVAGQTFNVHLRTQWDSVAGNISVEMEIDGTVFGTDSFVMVNSDWVWCTPSSFTLSDTEEHVLGIRINGKVDKVVVRPAAAVYVGDGPDYTASPYLTSHIRVFSVNGLDLPDVPLDVYDFKTTKDEIKRDGWYNFDLNSLSSPISFSVSYALVLVVSGSDEENYIVWEDGDTTEYIYAPSMVKE